MTTLPQTTPVRVPRAMAPATTAMDYPVAQAPAGASGQMTFSDVLRVLRSNLWLIILMVIAGAAGGWYLNRYLLQNYPKFTAVGTIKVETITNYDPLHDRSAKMGDTEILSKLKTYAFLLKTESLFMEALAENNDNKLRQLNWFVSRGPVEAKRDLKENLSAVPIPESELLSVSFTGSDAAECTTIVNTIVDLFLKQQNSQEGARETENRATLQRLVEAWNNKVSSLASQIQTVQMQLRDINYAPNDSTKHVFDQEVTQLVDSVELLRKHTALVTSAYQSAQKSIDEGHDPSEVEDKVKEDPRYRSQQQTIDALNNDRVALLIRYAPQHNAIKEVDARIAKAQELLDQVAAEVRTQLRSAYMSGLKSEMDSTKDQFDDQTRKLTDAKAKLTNASLLMANLSRMTEDERAYREMKNEAEAQLRNLNSAQADRNNVSWASKPVRPEIPTFPKLAVVMAATIALGLFMALGIAFLREVMNTSIRRPGDLARVGAMNLLGIISDESDDPQAAGGRLPLVIYDSPHSMTAEQFRQVRTRLQHSASLDTTRSIMVTGPSPLDGKTTVACNLAAGLALNGRKILLVDANFRRPELHRIFQIGNERGFSDALNGTAAFDDIIYETQVPNLSVVTAGPKPANATELFESQLLIDFIERALEEFDHVIFDAGPFPMVSDSVAMAPRVDGVITVVRAHADSRGLVSKMREHLRQVKAEHLGVVLNAVRAQGGGYYGRNIKEYYNYNEG